MSIKSILRNQIERFGYQITKPNIRNNHLLRRMKLLDYYNINFILDVGASIGQYAEIIRKAGFNGRIISIEPRSKAFNILKVKTELDDHWDALNFGLGNVDGELEINISGNADSSSFLKMLPNHIKHRPESKFIDKEIVNIHKIDSVFKSFYNENDCAFLKIDAQGYEYNILEGASESFQFINGLQLEMSIEPLYEGEKLICEMIDYLRIKGYKLMSIEPGSVDYATGQMFQVDGIFFKEKK